MGFVVEEDVMPDPVYVGLFGANGVVFALSCDSTGAGWPRAPGPAAFWEVYPLLFILACTGIEFCVRLWYTDLGFGEGYSTLILR